MLQHLSWTRTAPLMLALLLGCGGKQASQQPMPVGVTGIDWRLVTLQGNSPVVSATGHDPSLELTESRKATGYSGCNRFSGSYTLNGDSLRFGPLVTTRMACSGNFSLEQQYLAALGAVTRYQVNTDSLVLYKGNEPTAVYKR